MTLNEISRAIRNAALKQTVAVVFDLDSTLFCVSPRTEYILRQLGADPHFVSQFGSATAALLSNVNVRPDEYFVRPIVERLGVITTPELGEFVRAYWREHFFSDRHLERDLLYPSAAEFVRQFHDWGAKVLYLTGRPEGRMREGTERVLRQSNFPLAEVRMKPEDSEADEHFKVSELRRLTAHFAEIWFFENEPVIVRDVRALVPEINIVFVDSAHAGVAPVPENLPVIAPDYGPGLLDLRS